MCICCVWPWTDSRTMLTIGGDPFYTCTLFGVCIVHFFNRTGFLGIQNINVLN